MCVWIRCTYTHTRTSTHRRLGWRVSLDIKSGQEEEDYCSRNCKGWVMGVGVFFLLTNVMTTKKDTLIPAERKGSLGV